MLSSQDLSSQPTVTGTYYSTPSGVTAYKTSSYNSTEALEKPEIVLLDELDKLPRNFAEKLLGFLENGRVKVDQKNCQMDFELKGCKVFAAANEINRLSKPLQSRFRLLLPRYTEEQFLDFSEKVLSKTSRSIARYIGANVWKNGGDFRDVISIGKLVRKSDGPEQIELIMKTMMKYGMDGWKRKE